MISLSLNEFPNSSKEKEKVGLVWGCTVQPLSQELAISIPNEGSALATQIARCKKCYSYINPFVTLRELSWLCAHCSKENQYTEDRYNISLRSTLPELSNYAVDYRVHEPSDDLDLSDFPVFLMVVDITGPSDTEYFQRVQESIIAAMEGMPDSTRFGLITFSDRVGVWNLEGIDHPNNQGNILTHVHYIPIPESSKSPCAISIHQIISPERFLVPLGKNIASITSTIEKISSMGSSHDKRGLGATIQLVNEFFSNYDPMNVRVSLFLSGRPNYGMGFIANLSEAEQSIHPSSTYYQEQAKQANKNGICYDVIVIADTSKQFIGLPSLVRLSNSTGGNLSLYHPENRLCAQDMYKRYSSPMGFHCLLRLRCPSEYEVQHYYGHLSADDTFDDLYHAQGCDMWKTFAFDFKHSSPSGFIHSPSRKTVLQVAFAFAYLPGKSSEGNRHTVERRLRIHTIQVPRTLALPKLYASCNVETTLLILSHKLSQEVLKKGMRDVRNLLQDWLTLLLYKYNRFIVLPHGEDDVGKSFRATTIDMQFTKFENLVWLPRLVFGLLKSPLFSEKKLRSVDNWTFLYSLFCGQNSEFFRSVIYPKFSSYSSSHSPPSSENCCLSKVVMTEKEQHAPLLLLEGSSKIIVHFLKEMEALPPAKDSEIMKNVQRIQEQRFVSPRVEITCSANQLENFFENYLIEEHGQDGGSYSQFIESCNREVIKAAAHLFKSLQ